MCGSFLNIGYSLSYIESGLPYELVDIQTKQNNIKW